MLKIRVVVFRNLGSSVSGELTFWNVVLPSEVVPHFYLSVRTAKTVILVVIGDRAYLTRNSSWWLLGFFPSSWLCLALAVRKRASLSDPLSGPIPKSGVRGLLQQGKGSLKENSMGDKSEDQRGSQTFAPPRHQTAPLSSLPCFQLQSGSEMVRIMTLSIRQTFISSTLSLFLSLAFLECDRYHWIDGLAERRQTERVRWSFWDVMRIY